MIYYLNKGNIPTIPSLHDCVVKKVDIKQDLLTFFFEDNISARESIKCHQPEAKSLIVKIHLLDDFDTFELKDYKTPLCNDTYAHIDNKQLCKKAKEGCLEYLYHYIGYESIIIKLFCDTYICLDVRADYIEFEWIM
jgi:hypothetical protein